MVAIAASPRPEAPFRVRTIDSVPICLAFEFPHGSWSSWFTPTWFAQGCDGATLAEVVLVVAYTSPALEVSESVSPAPFPDSVVAPGPISG
jgi:hypothetical protein